MPIPEAVTDLVATPGDGQVALTWTAPADGGFAITDYIVQYRIATGTPSAEMALVDGLGFAIVDAEGRVLIT